MAEFLIILVFLSVLCVSTAEKLWGFYSHDSNTCVADQPGVLQVISEATSRVECLGLCSRSDQCESVEFNSESHSCVLRSDLSVCQSSDDVTTPGRKVKL